MNKNILIALLLLCISAGASAQPDPTQNGDGTTVGGEPIGTSAPIGNGAIIMTSVLALWIAYKELKKQEVKYTNDEGGQNGQEHL